MGEIPLITGLDKLACLNRRSTFSLIWLSKGSRVNNSVTGRITKDRDGEPGLLCSVDHTVDG